jgi:hypothetical protein
MGTPIIAYGAAVRTGYANADTACSTGAGGTQLKGGAGNPIQLMDDEDSFYLAKNPGSTGEHIYNSDDEPEANGFANGQTIYLPEQALSPAIGGRSTVVAGYYTLTAEAVGGGVNVFRVDADALADTTVCPFTYDYPDSFFGRTSDSGNDKQFQPMPDGQGTGEGILIDRNKNINLDFKMRTGPTTSRLVNQVPFILTAMGPQSLRGRGTSVYKCSTGDGDEA